MLCLTYLENVFDFSDDGLVSGLDAVVLGHVVDVVAEESADVQQRFSSKHRVNVHSVRRDEVLVLKGKLLILINNCQFYLSKIFSLHVCYSKL
jgi:hypothetical protein